MGASKEELLAAIAAAGTQGRVDYEQAQAANSQAQAEAIRMALSNGVAQSAGGGAQQELARIIGQPYQVSNDRLAANAQAQETWFNHSKWNSGVFQGNLDKLREALIAQTLAEQAAGGSGGGSGGGGGGKDPKEVDWYDNLKSIFGTQELGFKGIAAEAKNLGLNSSNESGLPRYLQTRQYAMDEYGVPEGVAASEYGPSKYAFTGDPKKPGVMESAATVRTKNHLKAFKKAVKQIGRQTPGNQAYWNRQAIQTAKKRVKRKRK
jgi:hypothetical protein